MPDERTPASDRFACRSVDQVVEAVRASHRDSTPLRITSGGRWLQAGNPVAATRSLDLTGLAGIVEYVPGDLTLTAHAGTSLADIAAATAEHRQWLPLDPFGDPRGTLGATLSTASAGPLGGSVGLPRDVTIGLTFVTGDGDVVHGGGRVVKNVAGFDLVRLAIGAWGTLGVITQATVRLRARPEADETVALTLPVERDAMSTFLSTVRTAMIDPLAAELLSPARSARAGLGRNGILLVRLAGNSTSVAHQRATLSRLAAGERVSNEAWSRLQRSDEPGGVVLRVSRRPTELARLWLAAMTIPDVDAHASLARGIVRLRLTSAAAFPPAAFDPGDRLVVECAPPAERAPFETLTMPNVMLSARLRDAFDPRRILNRGILGDEPS